MISNWKIAALAGAFALTSLPASAAILTLPLIGDIEHPDMDPFHVLTPPPPEAPAPAPAAMPMKHKKKMMKHKMKKKKM